jgi:hypothetical protein
MFNLEIPWRVAKGAVSAATYSTQADGQWSKAGASPGKPTVQGNSGSNPSQFSLEASLWFSAPLKRALRKLCVFTFVGLDPGGSGGYWEAPPKPSVCLPGASVGSGGLRDLRQTKAKNQET